jgi:KaiC/GvpD/RAD55 family RecA-like ATPase
MTEMDIKKELSENQIILLLVPSMEYNDLVNQIAKVLSLKSICYVTTNKTYDSLQESFQKMKVNLKNIVFIDTISQTIKETPKQLDSVYFISSPGALTETSLVISQFLRHGFEYIIFDSITNLLIYQKSPHVAEYLLSLVNKIKSSGTKAVFYALKTKEQESLIDEMGMFVDKVIDLSR